MQNHHESTKVEVVYTLGAFIRVMKEAAMPLESNLLNESAE